MLQNLSADMGGRIGQRALRGTSRIECSTLVAFTLTGIMSMQAPRPRRPETPDQDEPE